MGFHQHSATVPPPGLTTGAEQRLHNLSAIVFASNRGPVEYHQTESGDLEARRGNGGVVTALSAAAASAARVIPVSWVAAAMTEGDRLAIDRRRALAPPVDDRTIDVQLVSGDAEAYRLHYNVFCNPVLWFLQHGLWEALSPARSAGDIQEAWRRGYVAMNERFAGAVVAAAARHERPAILLQDYHLYLAPQYVRARLPKAKIAHFVHIPWPEPRPWRLLPSELRTAVHAAMCANDLVGFQTQADALRFLTGCETFLDGARADHAAGRVIWKGHATYARHYPISIDVAGLRQRASERRIRDLVARLRPLCGDKTIVRVDRLDPSKNVVRGFEALHVLLEACPELQGRLRFLAFLVPSRTDIPEYQSYHAQAMAAARSVNARFGREGWEPVQIFYEDNCDQAIAAMTLYDVLMVNPIADGMNLVAKEGPAVNDRNGVLLLSERAGAHEQLKAGATTINPYDVPGTARALADALTMAEGERARRLRLLRTATADYDIADWVSKQIEDLARLEAWPAAPATKSDVKKQAQGDNVPALVA